MSPWVHWLSSVTPTTGLASLRTNVLLRNHNNREAPSVTAAKPDAGSGLGGAPTDESSGTTKTPAEPPAAVQ